MPPAMTKTVTAPITAPITALGLFSGGLDSILAMKVVADQGIRVLGLHFCSPFFGRPDKLEYWQDTYGIELQAVDIHDEFVSMLRNGPRFGYGKVLNPCVDCKILMLATAKSLMPEHDARFIVSGEVLAQRPMSQRRDTLDLISKQAQVRDVLLRPLSALRMRTTPMEDQGLVDRTRLHGISGRGRKEQLLLAAKYTITEIPTPAGGCLLAEKESARRFWPLLTRLSHPKAQDFTLSCIGRQYWNQNRWLVVGRNRLDTKALEQLATEEDLLFKAEGVQGPLALGRQGPGMLWDEQAIAQAAAFVAGFSEKYTSEDATIRVRVMRRGSEILENCPRERRDKARGLWKDMSWDQVREEKKALMAEKTRSMAWSEETLSTSIT